MSKITIIALLCLTMLLGSCVKEELFYKGNIVDGEPAIVSVTLKGAQMGSGAKTKSLTDEQEREIRNIHVMVFNSKGALVTNQHFDNYTGGNITIPTYSGSGMTIFAVANGDAHTDIDKDLGKVTKLSDLYNIKVENTLHDLQRDKGLFMLGEIDNVDIKPGTSTLTGTPIKLTYLSAKVTLKVIDNTPEGQSVQLLGWDVVDVPTKGYLNQQSGDAVDIGISDDFFTTTGKYQFESYDPATRSAAQSLYLFENRRAGRAIKSLPTDPSKRYTGMGQTDNDDRGKAWYAPLRATHILIYAIHRHSGGSEQILAKIYLGGDNHSNYDITRGNHYNFTVTVNGLNDIKVDSNVDYITANMSVDYGTNLTMDAHPDFRPIRIQAPKGLATIEIIDDQDRAYDDPAFTATWLKISPLNLMCHQVKQAAGNWQQTGEVGDFVRAKYIPHKTVRTRLSGKGGWNTIPSGKENDDLMTLADATYRMCYKITDIPFTNVSLSTPQTLCVYADEYVSEMMGTRTAKVMITYLKDGDGEISREVKVLTITQRGPLTIFDMNDPDAGLARYDENGIPTTVRRKFVFEWFEEFAMVMDPGAPLSVQNTEGMQWGFYGVDPIYKTEDYRNGYFLTADVVYTDVTRINNEPTGFGKSLRPKYGNGITGGFGAIPTYMGTHSGAPYYYPTAEHNVYHPIYKSSAARYCHEKNRDVNGDGLIDASETTWYLPAKDELMMMLWIANVANVASFSSRHDYLCATDIRSKTTTWNVRSTNGFVFLGGSKNNPGSVRCIRGI